MTTGGKSPLLLATASALRLVLSMTRYRALVVDESTAGAGRDSGGSRDKGRLRAGGAGAGAGGGLKGEAGGKDRFARKVAAMRSWSKGRELGGREEVHGQRGAHADQPSPVGRRERVDRHSLGESKDA